jgi:hypothetical protein
MHRIIMIQNKENGFIENLAKDLTNTKINFFTKGSSQSLLNNPFPTVKIIQVN